MNQREKADFTQGSILNKLIPFMMPVLGALVLQAAYGAVDLLVVGRFGTTVGLSAVSTGSQILNLVTFVITQFAMGITVLIALILLFLFSYLSCFMRFLLSDSSSSILSCLFNSLLESMAS